MLKSKKGFSLIEVLITMGLFSIIALAVNKSIEMSLKSGAVSSSLLLDQDLKHTVGKSFEGVSCEKNMGSIIGDTITELKHYSSATDTTGETLLMKGLFKKKLDIIKLEVGSHTTDPSHKTFTVYYKRKGLGSLSTMGNEPCTTTSLAGCYTNICKLIYKTGGVDNTCDLLNCSTGSKNFLASVICPDGEYIESFRADGTFVCRGIETKINQDVLGTKADCGTDEYVKGFHKDGRLKCASLPPPPVLVAQQPPVVDPPPVQKNDYCTKINCNSGSCIKCDKGWSASACRKALRSMRGIVCFTKTVKYVTKTARRSSGGAWARSGGKYVGCIEANNKIHDEFSASCTNIGFIYDRATYSCVAR